MLRSLSGPSVSEALDDEEQLKLIIENLLLDPEREAVGSEIEGAGVTGWKLRTQRSFCSSEVNLW